MELTFREHKRAMIIRVTGRVDASVAPQFEAALSEQVKAGRTHVILEMDTTDYISSAGVRALISAQKALKGRGGGVLLSQPSTRVMEVLQIAGLDALFQTFPSTELALGDV
jgi:anti-anti-sigma factor